MTRQVVEFDPFGRIFVGFGAGRRLRKPEDGGEVFAKLSDPGDELTELAPGRGGQPTELLEFPLQLVLSHGGILA
jgi:hypothetical protein